MLYIFKKMLKNSKGFTFIFVMILAVVVLALLATLGVASRHNLYDAQTQQLNTKAYYLAREASEIAIAALLTQKVSGTDKLNSDYYNQLQPKLSPQMPLYNEANEEIGTSRFKLVEERDASGDTWAVIYITIKIDDYRISLQNTGAQTPKDKFEFYFKVKVLCENTNNKVYDVLTEDGAKE